MNETIEDIYPLTPMQQGMLFHTLLAPGSGMYVEQLHCRIGAGLDLAAFERALQLLIERHAILRTAFAWDKLKEPMQIVHRRQQVAVEQLDWHALPADERGPRFAQFLAEDSRRGFDLAHAPLLRFTLIRMDEGQGEARSEYRFVWTSHHILYDGWSFARLMGEFVAFYVGLSTGRPPQLERMRPYRDYIAWLKARSLDDAQAFWRRELADFTRPTPLGIDRALHGRTGFGEIRWELARDRTEALQQWTRRAGITMNTLMQGVWAILLSHYSRQEDIVFGATVSGRPPELPGVGEMVGLFINSLPVRTRVDRRAPLTGWLQGLQRRNALLRDFDFAPLQQIQGWSDIPAGGSLFDSLLVFENYPIDESLRQANGVLPITDVELVEQSNHAITFGASLTDQLELLVSYDRSRLDEATVERLLDHVDNLLRSIAHTPEARIGELEYLGEAERRTQLLDWNATATAAAVTPATAHGLFEAQARRTPQAVAVIDTDGTTLSYAELNRRANQLAHHLRHLGAGPDALVAVCLDRSAHALTSVVAVWKSGAAYLPLDPELPAERLAYIVADARPLALVTLQRFVPALSALGVPPVVLDANAQARSLGALSGENPTASPATLPAHLAYVIYTSGSTGRPKGVQVPHAALVNLAASHREGIYRRFGATGPLRVSVNAPFMFDVSLSEFVQLFDGHALCIVPEAVRQSADAMIDFLVQRKLDVLECTAIQLRYVIEQGGARHLPRFVVFGGDAIEAPLWRQLARIEGTRFFNLYGPTECTVDVTAGMPAPELPDPVIGRPEANSRIYLLDADFDPVPIGVAGELHVAGDGLARGYVGRPELSAEKFVPNPFEAGGARMYRTGDLARYLPDGNIEYLGRIDDQIKVRGFRVEPAEIEAVLQQLPEVRQAAVRLADDEQGDARLVAYVVASLDTEQTSYWGQAFDEIYRDTAAPDAAFDTAGWNSSYDNVPIAPQQMQEWLHHTLERIRALAPRSVLEIGCGTGMLLHGIAPACERYHGIDVSAAVVERLRRSVEAAGHANCEIRISEGAAHELQRAPGAEFDTVLINSVAQYFPNSAYLTRVLEEAIGALPAGGHVFVGDVRHFGLFETFHASLELHHAAPTARLDRVAQSLAQIMQAETELLIDPAYFFALRRRFPRIAHVEVIAKAGDAVNELTKFRYDVVLTVADAPPSAVEPAWLRWGELADGLEGVERMLREHQPQTLGLAEVPDPRLHGDLLARACLEEAAREEGDAAPRTVAELRATLQQAVPAGVEPNALRALAARSGYAVRIGVAAGGSGAFHAVFSRDLPRIDWTPLYAAASAEAALDALTNVPSSAPLHRVARQHLLDHLRAHLPDYMVPSRLVLLPGLPLTATGKINRQALAALDTKSGQDGPVAPRTPTEEILAGLWAEILRVPEVGVETNFFELGGHSLLATQVVSKVRAVLKVELPLRTLFEAPTVAQLASRIELARQEASGQQIPKLAASALNGPLPLSFAQQRLWFLHQLDPKDASYNMPDALRFSGRFDADALARAVREIVRRHAVLRTTFANIEGQPAQVIAPALELPLPIVDLSALAPEPREQEARRLADAEAREPFDLARGPLLRMTLLRLGANEHILLFTLHHAVADGWSIGVLMREVATLYTAFVQGRGSPLPELPIQYADFAVWQRQWLRGTLEQQQLAYWTQHLAGAPALLSLPTDRPRPAVQRHRGANIVFEIPAAATRALRALCQSSGTTLFMALDAVYRVLLWRHSSQRDISVGTAIANRTRSELEGLVGQFVNNLVLRTQLDPLAPFASLLQQVREVALGAYANQDVPFEQVVDALLPERSLSHQPLYQVMLLLQNTPMDTLQLPGVVLAHFGADSATAKCDLVFSVTEIDDALQLGVEYDTDLFDAGTVAAMARRFMRLLDSATARPEAPLRELSWLDEAERAQVLTIGQAPVVPSRSFATVLEAFARQAYAAPNRVAVVCGGQALSYAQLDARSNQLARHLRTLGVDREVRAGVCMVPSLPAIVAILAIMKAGGAYLPLDAGHAGGRLRGILADAAPAVVVTDAASKSAVTEAGMPLVCVDQDSSAIARHADAALDTEVLPAQLAYLIYTSGSTGRPKAVQVTHGSLANLLQSMRDVPGMTADDVMLSVTSLAFDLVVPDLFLPLVCGAHTVYAGPEASVDPARLVQLIAQHGVSFMQATPSTWRMLVDHGAPFAGEGFKLLCGGEALPRDLAARLLAQVPVVWNMYGPTETTVWSTLRRIDRAEDSTSVGRPLANTQVYLLDAQGEPVPTGVVGELFVGGEGLARGYLGRADLTAERFVPDVLAGEGRRLYRTGDLARWLPEGELEYLGRADHQVKLRGFRIELGEVEAALRALPVVREAVVLARETAHGDKRLVAYLVGDEQEFAVLREALSQALPEYMLPAHAVWLPALPLTPNGKLDRAALPAPDMSQGQAGYVAPASVVEVLLAQIWTELLGVPQVGVHDNFFALGGHSLLATQLVSRLRTARQIELPLRTLFEAPTIAELAPRLLDANASLAPMFKVSRDQALPLSFAQQRLWFLDQLEPGSAAYHVPGALRLRGALDADALQRALDEIVLRHEVLRTHFVAADGSAVQVIADVASLSLPLTDLSHLPSAERQARVEWLIQQESLAPFDLSTGPLVRAGLVRMSADEHVLSFTLHHIVCDGWSMGVLVDELAALYTAFAQGRPSPLAPLSIQYADYAAWQRQWLAGEPLERQLDHWKSELAGAPSLLALPTDRQRPAVQSYRGDTVSLIVPAETTKALRALGRSRQSTLFMTLSAALQLLLWRLTNQNDVCIGTPIANRTRAETEPLIGCFINTLVLRGRLDAGQSFNALLDQSRATTLSAYANQDLPFEQLVDAMQLPRHLSHSPLFQVLLALQNAPEGALELSGLSLESLSPAWTVSKYDLSLYVNEIEDQLACSFEYNTDLFDASTIERFAGYFQTLLDSIVRNADARIAELELLDAPQRARLIETFNDTALDVPAALLPQAFEAQASRTPEAIAAIFEDNTLSYAALNARANRLAHHLRTLGVGPEVRVAVCMERSLDLLAALLAVLKAGGAYVPLDPAYPQERLSYMLEDAKPAVLLTHSHLGIRGELPTLDLDLDWAGDDESNPESSAQRDNLAYVLYTSGSTGRPKGVQVTHLGVINFLTAMQQKLALSAKDVLLSVTTLSFDIAVLELYLPLLTGARTVLASRDDAIDPSALERLLAKHGASAMQATPSTWRMLMDHGWQPAHPGFRILCGGEALPPDLAQRLLQHVPALANLYGPTETTVWSTFSEVERSEDGAAPRVTIGGPIANTQIHLLDAEGEPAPLGVAGELFIAGDGLARGYLGRADLTAERFVPDPFAGNGRRMYRSGDLARWLPHGEIDYLGRIDHQVKLRGFRIELGEIETALRALPAIRESVVLAREDSPGDKRLVAYLVGEEQDLAVLRTELAKSLPDYMLPAHVVWLQTLPLTPNGKLDRNALPAPDFTEALTTYAAPSSPTELLLTEAWSDLLGIPRIGIHDNFFALGGHSLLATQLVSRLRATRQIELPLRALFEAPTIAELAPQLLTAGVALAPIGRVPRDQPLSLSFGQQRMWFLDQLETGSAAYHIPAALRLSGPLDIEALHRSFNEIVRRHEALRTTFASVADQPVQVIAPEMALPLPVADLSPLPAAQREARVLEMAGEEAMALFDIHGGPLIRVHLLRLDAQEHVVLLTVHHIVSDGWSMGVLLDEFAALYDAFSAGKPSPLPELAIQYADFSAWQRTHLTHDTLQAQVDYWTRQLEDSPTLLALPTDRPRPVLQRYPGAVVEFSVDKARTAGLMAVGQRQQATLFMTLTAAFGVLLSRYAGQWDICIGTPIANRQRADLEPMIGLFINTLVMRARIDPAMSFDALLRQVRATALDAYANQDLPFEYLVDALKLERHLSHAPLFQAMLTLQNAPGGRMSLPELKVTPLNTGGQVAKFDLSLFVTESEGQLDCSFEYKTDLFDASTVERMTDHFQRLLDGIVADARMPVGDLPLVGEAEQRHMLRDWNDTASPYPAELGLHQLFAQHAARTPDAPCVVVGRSALSYRQADLQSNRLAHHLRRLGVGPEVKVAICIDRSTELIVALLAVLKAGGVYVPLDASFPIDRLAFMIEDADARVLLTQGALRNLVPELSIPAFCLDTEWELVDKLPCEPLPSLTRPDNLAYVIYTSGSTGRPKGVQITHHGIVNYLHWGVTGYPMTQPVGSFTHLPLIFDASLTTLFIPLAGGKDVHLPPPGGHERIFESMRTPQRLSMVKITPAHVDLLAAALEPHEVKTTIATSVIGGDILTPAQVRTWLRYFPGTTIVNEYGPTETVVGCCVDYLDATTPLGKSVPIGKPIANMQHYVLDARGHPVPPGVVGALCIAGAGMARGYLNRPALTAEKFTPDPFGPPGSRMYSAGDIARYLPDGRIDFLGRVDNQVKIRGFRIELGEIEAALAVLPGVQEAVVLARDHVGGQKQLVAYLVAVAGIEADTRAWRAALQQALPDYMVPAHFVVLEQLPLTTSGKVDRKALPEPGAHGPTESYVAPRNETEQALARIWARVLGLERVGIDDNFFDIGGNSLLAVQLSSHVTRQLSVTLPLTVIFESQTVARMGRYVDEINLSLALSETPDTADTDATSMRI